MFWQPQAENLAGQVCLRGSILQILSSSLGITGYNPLLRGLVMRRMASPLCLRNSSANAAIRTGNGGSHLLPAEGDDHQRPRGDLL